MITARMTNQLKPLTRWDNLELGRIVLHTITSEGKDDFLCLTNANSVLCGDSPDLGKALQWLAGNDAAIEQSLLLQENEREA
jgi:hypothetical protein